MDRQDIDALLIGSLYGELTPAEEARLASHLESHPADRSALDDLKSARQAVRSSRIFDVQAEPPQAISALLLQEAARRAPRRAAERSQDEKEGWFARFVRSFVAHPGVAAAAMLVLVVSVAGTIYMNKGGDQFAERTAGPAPTMQAAEPAPGGGAVAKDEAPAAAATPSSDGSGEATAAGSAAYAVGLAEKQDVAQRDQRQQAVERAKLANAQDEVESKKATPDVAKETKAKPVAKKGIVVGGFDRAPKDMPEGNAGFAGATRGDDLEDSGRVATGSVTGAPGAASGGGGHGTATTTVAPTKPAPTKSAAPRAPIAQQPQPAPAPPPPAQAGPAPANDKFAEAPSADAEQSKAKQDPLFAWAKNQHSHAIALAQQGKCPDAAKVAVAVSMRAPDYFAQYMASDRLLKSCRQYIDAEREKDAERSAKTRAQKRATTDEAPAQSK